VSPDFEVPGFTKICEHQLDCILPGGFEVTTAHISYQVEQ
jgi:hypothetical protein